MRTAIIAVAGEQQRCRIYEYKKKLVRCKPCLEYYQTVKRCEKTVTVCGRCAQTGHRANECSSTMRKCYHCEGDHHVGDRHCPEQRKYKEILAIQAKMRVSRERARIIYSQQRPMKDISYAQAAREERAKQGTNKNDQSNAEGIAKIQAATQLHIRIGRVAQERHKERDTTGRATKQISEKKKFARSQGTAKYRSRVR